MTAAEKFRRLLDDDRRYDPEAYSFVYEALDYTLKEITKSTRAGQHVAGPELLDGIRQFGIEQFGCLVRPVFESWGIQRTRDFGHIVFNLVKHDLMGKQDSDRLEDFEDVFDFDSALEVRPVFHYSREREEWWVQYVPRGKSSGRNRPRARSNET